MNETIQHLKGFITYTENMIIENNSPSRRNQLKMAKMMLEDLYKQSYNQNKK